MGQVTGIPTVKPAAGMLAMDQSIVLRGYPDSVRAEAAILNELRGKVVAIGTVTLRNDPIAGWTAKITDPISGLPSVLIAYDTAGGILGIGNLDAAAGTDSIPRFEVLDAAAGAVQEIQHGW